VYQNDAEKKTRGGEREPRLFLKARESGNIMGAFHRRRTQKNTMETERELKDRFDAVRERADALRRHL